MQGQKLITETSELLFTSCRGTGRAWPEFRMAAGVLCFRAFALSMACLLLAVPLLVAQDPSKLRLEYSSKTCPNVEHVVRTEMECAVRADTRNAALMLRLHFHDCFVQVSTLCSDTDHHF